MPKVFLIKTEYGFLPSADMDKQITDKIGIGEEIEVLLRKARNPKFHRKFFAMLNVVLQNQEKYDNLEDLLTEVKIRVGHYSEYITDDGKIVYTPKSISFEKMDEIEFNKFYNKSIDSILDGKIIKLDKDELLLAVMDFT